MIHNPISENRQKLLDAKKNSELAVGELVSVLEKAVSDYRTLSTKSCTCTISSLKDGITVFTGIERDRSNRNKLYKITKEDITSRNLREVGANPFEENIGDIRPVAFGFDSILLNLDVLDNKDSIEKYDIEGVNIEKSNWNPFIYTKNGEKKYYQRPFVWSLKDKQLLIESIYQNIDCGKILVRKRSWEELREFKKNGETELAWNDIVDGKQRLNAVKCFMEGQFADLQGNYYADLSFRSQHKFTSHQLFSYAEMPENTRDEDVIKQFLKLNFAGVPQSLEHIEFVKSLQNK